jgi:hypothetical protein
VRNWEESRALGPSIPRAFSDLCVFSARGWCEGRSEGELNGEGKAVKDWEKPRGLGPSIPRALSDLCVLY